MKSWKTVRSQFLSKRKPIAIAVSFQQMDDMQRLKHAIASGNVEECYRWKHADVLTQTDVTPELVDILVNIVGAQSITSVGCGTGLAEWFYSQGLGVPVIGIEPCVFTLKNTRILIKLS